MVCTQLRRQPVCWLPPAPFSLAPTRRCTGWSLRQPTEMGNLIGEGEGQVTLYKIYADIKAGNAKNASWMAVQCWLDFFAKLSFHVPKNITYATTLTVSRFETWVGVWGGGGAVTPLPISGAWAPTEKGCICFCAALKWLIIQNELKEGMKGGRVQYL